MPPLLVAYDSRWPRQFERFADHLRRHGSSRWEIEHIGSTAVPGMRAKPVIDVAVRVADAAEFDEHCPSQERAGWRVGSGVRTHRVMLLERRGSRVAIAHFFEAPGWDAANQRVLRDRLLTHPEDAARYEQAKIAAAAQDRKSYSEAKTRVIQEIVDAARRERGLAPVPVYDK